MRLCDATTGYVEDRAAATSLTPTGNVRDPYDRPNPEAVDYDAAYEAWLVERERELACVDADDVLPEAQECAA